MKSHDGITVRFLYTGSAGTCKTNSCAAHCLVPGARQWAMLLGQYHHHQPSASQITTPWNVRTPYACGEVKQLTHEIVRYSWDILGMAKVRCTGCSEISMEEAHKLCYSGKDSRHQQGVGFVVNKNKLKSVISCTPKSSRLISIRVATWPWNVTIIQVYARRMDYDDDKVEKFH